MDLLASYDSDDDDDHDIEEAVIVKKAQHLPPAHEVLKNPSSSSVFQNQYESKKEQEMATLEKHVKMVENKNDITEVNGKQVCWMYRKGKCRFGKRCKMFHDSDLREAALREGKEFFVSNPAINDDSFTSTYDDNSGDGPPVSKKKRHGVTNTLEPSKKALKDIKRIQHKEKFSLKK